jgi:kynurenine formamidase
MEHETSVELSGRVGALSEIDAQKVIASMACVRTGRVFSLNKNLEDAPYGGRASVRRFARLHNFMRPIGPGRYVVINDDGIESFALQGTSHWDSLAHIGCIESATTAVYYGGAGLQETYPEARAHTLGIDALGPAVISRGVLVDLVQTAGSQAPYVSPDVTIDVEYVRRCIEHHKLHIGAGDVVLLYTGFENAMEECGGKYPERIAGIDASTLALWRQLRVSALVCDNVGVEPVPIRDYALHIGALRDLGLPLGELFALRQLAMACRDDGIYDFLFVSVPLNLPGAFGSPANAVAIR